MKTKAIWTNSALAASLFAVSHTAHALQYGLGVGANDHSDTIYVPIEIAPGVRVEPFMRWSRQQIALPDSPREITTSESGVGAFWSHVVAPQINSYGGLRVSYYYVHVTRSDIEYELKQSGVTVAPTVGAEYALTPNLAIAAEAALEHTEIDALGGTESSPGVLDGTEKSTHTSTQLVVRFVF